MILIIFGMFVTLLVLFMLFEISKINKVAVGDVVMASAWSQKFSYIDLENKKEKYLLTNEKYHRDSQKKIAKKVKGWDKQIADYRAQEEKYMTGRSYTLMDQIAVFGYQLMIRLKLDGNNETVRKLTKDCEVAGYIELERNQETGGKKNAAIYAFFLLASCIGYVYVGVILALVLAIMMTAAGREASNVLLFSIVGFALPTVIGIIPITSLQERSAKRQEEIDLDFANIISKMALLVTAGMNIVNAAEEASKSGSSAIYLEFRQAVKEIHQSSSVSKAFSDLQCRCSNRYLDKLVSLVSKSFVSGNANLAEDLRTINAECWLEKRHQSRRMGEKIQNKLFIPTMLMFVGILIVIIVPAMSGLSI